MFIKILLILLESHLTWTLIREGNKDTGNEIHAEPTFARPWRSLGPTACHMASANMMISSECAGYSKLSGS